MRAYTIFTMLSLAFVFSFSATYGQKTNSPRIISLNTHWKFTNVEDLNEGMTPYPFLDSYNDAKWANVTLPHTAYVEPLVVIKPWKGQSWYRKLITADPDWQDKKVILHFEGVMQLAEIWLNGKHIFSHKGGYLPFAVDLSQSLRYDKPNLLVVLTDNSEQADVPPGKPIEELDFCYYSGIYRNVYLSISHKVHISDPVLTNKSISGTSVTFPEVEASQSQIAFSTAVANELEKDAYIETEWMLLDAENHIQGRFKTPVQKTEAGTESVFKGNIKLPHPVLWSPENPYLYTLLISVYADGKMVDSDTLKTGIRKFELSGNTFLLNGKPYRLYGTNRHQEYPYLGNAISDNAQYRDAVKIREAGFNLVRLSHYPQSPAFMNACDELGLLTINCIPGWQFFGNAEFENRSYQDARELIRRDRNHSCVALWELSINETEMPDRFMEAMVRIASEESPNQKLITCGWMNKYYDLFIPARQHAKAPDYWKKHQGDRPFLTAEYGDWEYYAQNAGFNQTGFGDLKSEERSSRQLREYGERRMLQQAYNYQEAHNDNLKSSQIGDANWLIFDYNRGYSPDIESSGIMDIFRIPKFAFYFYQSQRSPYFKTDKFNSGPMVKIASHCLQESDSVIKVFSNCDEVAFYANNKLIARKATERTSDSDKLMFPPFVFHVPENDITSLKAEGYLNGIKVTEDVVNTAAKADKILLSCDLSHRILCTDDVIFVYATVADKAGNTVHSSSAKITFAINGDAVCVLSNVTTAEAGIATIVLKTGMQKGNIEVTAEAEGLRSAVITLSVQE